MKTGMIRGLIVLMMIGVAAPAFADEEIDAAEREAARKALEEARAELDAARQQLREAARAMAESYSEGELNSPRALAYSFVTNPRKAMLGVVLESAEGGLELVGVTPAGPAEEAGLRTGDVIVSINGKSVVAEDNRGQLDVLLDEMENLEIGDEAQIEFLRDGERLETVVIADRREPFMWHDIIEGDFDVRFSDAMEDIEVFMENGMEIPDFSFSFSPDQNVIIDRTLSYSGLYDVELVSMNEGLGSYFGTDRGVLVLNAPEGNSWGLRAGDVITRIDGRDPVSPAKAWRILRSYEPGESVDLIIMRDHTEQSVAAVVPETSVRFGPHYRHKDVRVIVDDERVQEKSVREED